VKQSVRDVGNELACHVGFSGKLVDFSSFYVRAKLGICRSDGLEPQFIVMRSDTIIPASA